MIIQHAAVVGMVLVLVVLRGACVWSGMGMVEELGVGRGRMAIMHGRQQEEIEGDGRAKGGGTKGKERRLNTGMQAVSQCI